MTATGVLSECAAAAKNWSRRRSRCSVSVMSCMTLTTQVAGAPRLRRTPAAITEIASSPPPAGCQRDLVMQWPALVEHALRDVPPGRDQAAARVGDAEAQREVGGAHPDQLLERAAEHAHRRRVGVGDPAVVAEQQHAVGDALDDRGGQAPDAVEARRAAKRHRVQQQAGERDEDPALGGLDARDEDAIVADRVQDDVGEAAPTPGPPPRTPPSPSPRRGAPTTRAGARSGNAFGSMPPEPRPPPGRSSSPLQKM